MSAASVAVPTLMIALVFTPAKIVRDASGKKTFQSCACGSNPSAAADSRTPVGMSCRPVAVFRTIGRRLYKKRAKFAATALIPEKVAGTSNARNATEGIVYDTPPQATEHW